MADISNPLIDPTHFDLIVVGTGLPESLVAAAASAAGKSVLHLDNSHFYGSQFASLSFDDFNSWLQSQSLISTPLPQQSPPENSSDDEIVTVNLEMRPLYSEIEISTFDSESLGPSRSFNLDLAGPRVLLCADSTVDLMLKSGASHHVEFKSVDQSFVWSRQGLSPVPDSRAGIFKDRILTLPQKNQLMRFFKLVQEHFGSPGQDGEKSGQISDEDLDSPFVEFMGKQRLPSSIKSIILYAISLASCDQENPGDHKNLLKTRDGIERLSLYHSSVGRFPNAQGAFIYPIYGQGELPQAFCRCAAVKGAIYVLRTQVAALLIAKANKHYRGVRLASGQDLFSPQLVMNPSYIVPPSILSSQPDLQLEGHEASNLSKVTDVLNRTTKVARGVCIIRGSLQPELSNLLLVFPPRSLYSMQATAIRALQLGSNLAVCPPGLFVMYLSTLCVEAMEGKDALHAAIDVLFVHPLPNNSVNGTSAKSEDLAGEGKPFLMWSALYVQELTEGSSSTISSCPMPDGNLDYRDLVESSMKLLREIYPTEEFFPESSPTESTENDDS